MGRAWEALGNYYLQFDDEHSLNHAYYCLTFAGMARFQVREQLKLYRQKMRLLNKFPNTAWELYPRDREEEEEKEKEKENKIIKKWENSEAYHSSYEGYARQKFQKINEYLEREFSSSIWAKATPETKVYLATGFYCFEQFSIINLGYLKIDFSAAINPVVRSLEEELALRFYSRYIKYLKAHYPTPEDYFEVNGIASYNKKTRYVIVHLNKYNAFSYNDAAKTDKFTLGSFGFVVGCGWSLGKDARIDKTMLEYCTKDLLSPTDFCKMKGISFLAANFEEEISGWLLELCAIVQKIKDIRNKASHGGSICSVVECEYCYNAILLVKKILIQLLEVSKLIN